MDDDLITYKVQPSGRKWAVVRESWQFGTRVRVPIHLFDTEDEAQAKLGQLEGFQEQFVIDEVQPQE